MGKPNINDISSPTNSSSEDSNHLITLDVNNLLALNLDNLKTLADISSNIDAATLSNILMVSPMPMLPSNNLINIAHNVTPSNTSNDKETDNYSVQKNADKTFKM